MHRILLAEDNPGDVLLFREALRTSDITCELTVAQDGERALNLLQAESEVADGPKPDLIVLDINLPRRSGQDVLRWLRGNHAFANVPVIMLTSSASPEDKTVALELGANLYLQKSSDLDELFEIGRTVQGLLSAKFPDA